MSPLVIDVHTHVYTPALVQLLRERTTIPRIVSGADGQERMLLLKEEVQQDAGASGNGRPIGPQYWDTSAKLAFMDQHEISVSVVSLANPWLDFFESPREALQAAQGVNNDLQSYCSATGAPSLPVSQFSPLTANRLFAFGSLPLVPGIELPHILETIEQIKGLPALRGVVMGTKGVGNGLDDEEMEPIWEALADSGLVVFVHPHYGIEGAFGTRDNGHVLPLGLAFPMETTIAITRLILAGVLDRHPSLKLLIAHSAGALPALSSRLASCVAHDPTVKDRLQHDFRFYLGQLYFDAVAYGPEELAFLERVIARADHYEGREEELEFCDRVTGRKDLTAPEGTYPGSERILFGTDHPFFPPLDGPERWKSVDENLDAIAGVPGWGEEERESVLGANAVELFGLEL